MNPRLAIISRPPKDLAHLALPESAPDRGPFDSACKGPDRPAVACRLGSGPMALSCALTLNAHHPYPTIRSASHDQFPGHGPGRGRSLCIAAGSRPSGHRASPAMSIGARISPIGAWSRKSLDTGRTIGTARERTAQPVAAHVPGRNPPARHRVVSGSKALRRPAVRGMRDRLRVRPMHAENPTPNDLVIAEPRW